MLPQSAVRQLGPQSQAYVPNTFGKSISFRIIGLPIYCYPDGLRVPYDGSWTPLPTHT